LLAVAARKFVAAAFTGSSVMLAEGFHSLIDTGNERLLLIGLERSNRVADDGHAFGHGKATYFWALMVALSVSSLGGGISIHPGVVSLYDPPALDNPYSDPAVSVLIGLLLIGAAFLLACESGGLLIGLARNWPSARCAGAHTEVPIEWQAVVRRTPGDCAAVDRQPQSGPENQPWYKDRSGDPGVMWPIGCRSIVADSIDEQRRFRCNLA
jgi:hypothetical protein